MNWVKEYYRRIECGDIVTSKRVRAVYSRLVAEMDAANDDSPYYFDEETGERPILFIETFCKQSQGTIGAPLELELFQKAYIQLLFGWLEKETGYRRFRETMFLCGRKTASLLCFRALPFICSLQIMRARRRYTPLRQRKTRQKGIDRGCQYG